MKKTTYLLTIYSFIFLIFSCQPEIIKVHTHTWDTGIVTVEVTGASHGEIEYKCSGCDEKKVELVHPYSEWMSDETKHWRTPLCSHNVQIEEYDHNFQFNKTITAVSSSRDGREELICPICKKTIEQPIHRYDTNWSYDLNSHWHNKLCTHDISPKDYGQHNWTINRTTNIAACSVCDLKTVISSNNAFVIPDHLEIPLCLGNQNQEHEDHQIRPFTYYTLCYRETYEEAEWSAYKLTSNMLNGTYDRVSTFFADPVIETGTAISDDYKNSGYHRGHLTPAADMKFAEDAEKDTFYLSNICPQNGSLNTGKWSSLEKKVRDWCEKYGTVYVVSGPILEKPADQYSKIGTTTKIAVPEYFYKVILVPFYKDEQDAATPQTAMSFAAIGFILPNNNVDNLYDYACDIDTVEQRTGLDFFSALDDSIETLIESTVNIDLWK